MRIVDFMSVYTVIIVCWYLGVLYLSGDEGQGSKMQSLYAHVPSRVRIYPPFSMPHKISGQGLAGPIHYIHSYIPRLGSRSGTLLGDPCKEG